MGELKSQDDKEVQRINLLQDDFFSKMTHLFDPPLPKGVPERLKKIVAEARLAKGDIVLDVGSGTGILIPYIMAYNPGKIIACDLSKGMLRRLKEKFCFVETMLSDVRNLSIPDASLNAVFMNACYPNIADKRSSFANIARMMLSGGRMVISHPLGRSFVCSLKEQMPFPIDDLPEIPEAESLFSIYGFEIEKYVNEPELYILLLVKR